MAYVHTAATAQAVAALFQQRPGGARALMVTGPPGAGKTALAEAIASERGAHYVYALLHSWSGADDLFRGIDVGAAVAGDATRVHQPGVLALVAEASARHELVVVCLDELDKAPEPVEALLLDWLQSGRVPVRPGEHLRTRLDRVLVVLTSNGTRPHSDALLRRCRRLRLGALPADVRYAIVAERAGVPAPLARAVDRVAQLVAEAEGTEAISVQEIAHCAHEVAVVAQSADDVAEAIRCWIARDVGGVAAVDTPEVRGQIATIWGLVVAARRRAQGVA